MSKNMVPPIFDKKSTKLWFALLLMSALVLSPMLLLPNSGKFIPHAFALTEDPNCDNLYGSVFTSMIIDNGVQQFDPISTPDITVLASLSTGYSITFILKTAERSMTGNTAAGTIGYQNDAYGDVEGKCFGPVGPNEYVEVTLSNIIAEGTGPDSKQYVSWDPAPPDSETSYFVHWDFYDPMPRLGRQPFLTVQSQDGDGNSINGYFVEVIGQGQQRSDFTPARFNLDSGATYTVIPADYGDFVFDYWYDNGETNREREISITGDIGITAVYQHISETQPSMTLNAGYARWSYGLVQISGNVQNPNSDVTTVNVKVTDSDGQIVRDGPAESVVSEFDGSIAYQAYFRAEREHVEESYTIEATYEGMSETMTLPPFCSEFTCPPVIVGLTAFETTVSSVSIQGRVDGGFGGDEVNVSVYSPADEQLYSQTVTGNGKSQFAASITAEEAQAIFTTNESYRIVAMHVPTGVSGEMLFSYSGTAPPSDEAISISTTFAHYQYGLVLVNVAIQDPASSGNGVARMQLFEPDGTLIADVDQEVAFSEGKAFFQDGFMVEREFVYDSYEVAVTYNNLSATHSVPPFSSEFEQPPSISVEDLRVYDDGTISTSGHVWGGIFKENLTMSAYSPDNELIGSTTSLVGLHAQFGGTIEPQIPLQPGSEYRIVYQLEGTDTVTEETFTFAATGQVHLSVATSYSGSPIYGYHTILYDSGGNAIQTGFSPVEFLIDVNQEYVVTVADYGEFVFDHWEDTGSTTRDRSISISSDASITAVYRNVNEPPTPPDEEEEDGDTTPAGQSTITVRTIDSGSNSEIFGYHTILYDNNGAVIETGFSPATFDVTSGQTYTVEVQDYGSYYFNYWQDNSDTDRDRTITATDDETTLTAVYSTSPSATPPSDDIPEEEEQPPEQTTDTISVTTVDSSGNQIYGYHTTLSQNGNVVQTAFSPAEFTVNSEETYQVAVADYGQYVFDHWSDGSIDRFHNAEAGESLTAVYRP